VGEEKTDGAENRCRPQERRKIHFRIPFLASA